MILNFIRIVQWLLLLLLYALRVYLDQILARLHSRIWEFAFVHGLKDIIFFPLHKFDLFHLEVAFSERRIK